MDLKLLTNSLLYTTALQICTQYTQYIKTHTQKYKYTQCLPWLYKCRCSGRGPVAEPKQRHNNQTFWIGKISSWYKFNFMYTIQQTQVVMVLSLMRKNVVMWKWRYWYALCPLGNGYSSNDYLFTTRALPLNLIDQALVPCLPVRCLAIT